MAQYKDLHNKSVVITGGASGIGLATAERFAREGARVVIFDINLEALERVTEEHPEFAGALRVDVSSPQEVERGFEEAEGLAGPVDVLVANAGISIRSSFKDISWEQWRRVMGYQSGRNLSLCPGGGETHDPPPEGGYSYDCLHQRHRGSSLLCGLQRLQGGG